MLRLSLLFVLTLGCLTHSLPVAEEETPELRVGLVEPVNPEHVQTFSNNQKYEMRLTPEQEKYLKGDPETRNVMRWSNYHWPGSTLVYSFGPGLSAWDHSEVQRAMAGISMHTCVRFRYTSNPHEAQVVVQRTEGGCWSYIGFLNWQVQPLNLGEGCIHYGTIQHELLHALGVIHQQADPHRDNYVRIAYENVQPGMEGQFDKWSANDVSDFGFGYDYGSVMHYGAYDFSKNGQPTIIPHNGAYIGQNEGISWTDVYKLNHVYC